MRFAALGGEMSLSLNQSPSFIDHPRFQVGRCNPARFLDVRERPLQHYAERGPIFAKRCDDDLRVPAVRPGCDLRHDLLRATRPFDTSIDGRRLHLFGRYCILAACTVRA